MMVRYLLASLILALLALRPLWSQEVVGQEVESQKVETEEAIGLPDASDVRVLIDISGSMKQNDPKNLRIPALNLITQLLPEGNKAGVWTFGRQVNQLVRHGKVDKAWRELARSQSSRINSVALFTNIGAALEKAAFDLKEGAASRNVHLILLTDGVVDISKKPEENTAERERILSKLLPRFKATGAQIHTVALSRNADTSLLEKLALETGGLAAIAESSEDLSRIFVQALDQAVPAEKVPIQGNKFSIDKSIQEFTALIFTKADALPVKLVDPAGNRFDKGQHPANVKWFRDRGYDLITVEKPVQGDWLVEADLQPGSRVTVITNLRMVASELPANFFPGDALDLTVAFFEDDAKVTAPDFLNVIDVDVTITNEENLSGTKRVSVAGQPPADGLFRESITKLKRMGRYTVTVSADGKTFRREQSQAIQLRSPLDVELEGTGAGQDSRYKLSVVLRSDNIVPEQTTVMATLNAPDGSQAIKTIPYDAESRRWELMIEPSGGEGQYLAQVSVDGVVKGGQKFQLQPGAVSLNFPRKEGERGQYASLVNPAVAEQAVETIAESAEEQASSEQEAAQEPMVDLAKEAEAEPAPESETAEPVVEESTGIAWWVWAVAAGGVLALGGGGFWFWKRRGLKTVASAAVAASAEDKTQVRVKEEAAAPADTTDIDIDDELDVVGDLDPPPIMTGNTQVDLADAVTEMTADEPMVDGKTPEELADEILADNKKVAEEIEEEFNLEDFDISDTDGLPQPDKPENNK